MFATFAFLVLLSFGPPNLSASTDEPPLKILLITDGGWHDRRRYYQGDRPAVERHIHCGHEVGTDPSAEPTRFADPDWAKDFDLVLFSMSLSTDQKPERAQAIVDGHVKHGVPPALLHDSTHSYRRTGFPNWSHFLGARSMRPPLSWRASPDPTSSKKCSQPPRRAPMPAATFKR